MVNLREQAESDLQYTLEGDFKLPVILIDPDGVKQTLKKDSTDPLVGQIIFDTLEENPETGQQIIVHKPLVVLRRSSLDRIPIAGEKWVVKIPTVPVFDTAEDDMTSFNWEDPNEGGGSIGFIRMYLVEMEQS